MQEKRIMCIIWDNDCIVESGKWFILCKITKSVDFGEFPRLTLFYSVITDSAATE